VPAKLSAIQSTPRLTAKAGVGAILVGQRRDRQQRVGHVDALARLDHAAVHDAAVDMSRHHALDLEFEVAVVDQDRAARF
jgi:hypothetical protein